MKKRISLLILICLIFVIPSTPNAKALTEDPPVPEHLILGDGFVFYLTPSEYEEEGYRKSGLYRYGIRIYTVEDISGYSGTFYFSSDAMSFFILPLSWYSSASSVYYYHKGVCARTYNIAELLPEQGEFLRDYGEFCGISWDKSNQRYYHRENDMLQITTREGIEITFDLSTGLIIEEEDLEIPFDPSTKPTTEITWERTIFNEKVIITILVIGALSVALFCRMLYIARKGKSTLNKEHKKAHRSSEPTAGTLVTQIDPVQNEQSHEVPPQSIPESLQATPPQTAKKTTKAWVFLGLSLLIVIVLIISVFLLIHYETVEIAGDIYRTNSTVLDLSDRALTDTDIEPLRYMVKLKELNLSNNQITDCYWLYNLSNLTELDLSNNQIKDITMLSGLNNLRRLNLHGNRISDASAVRYMHSLWWVDYNGNDITDSITLAGKAYDTSEESISVMSRELSDPEMDALKLMVNLTSLKLRDCKITDISVLEGLVELRELDLGSNQINDIRVLSVLINLEKLNLGTNEISDISALRGLTNLTELHLGNNKISDISALRGLTNLANLNLGNNEISDISALQELVNITRLDLFNNKISDINVISELSNLTNLELAGNKISDFRALRELISLRNLDLSNNEISDLSQLQGMQFLTRLNLSDNKISDISALEGFNWLTWLSLDGNLVSDVNALKGLRGIKILFLHDNQISREHKRELLESLPDCVIVFYY